jgi:hypothetical protein
VHNRKDPLHLDAVRLSAERAYAMAQVTAQDISFAELHDAFTVLEMAISEEVGFYPRGKAVEAVRRNENAVDGKLPLNTSGGLKAKGHPVGATGVSQVVELVRQLRARPSRPAGQGPALRHGGELRRVREQRGRHHLRQGVNRDRLQRLRDQSAGDPCLPVPRMQGRVLPGAHALQQVPLPARPVGHRAP